MVQYREILAALPKELFVKNSTKAWSTLLWDVVLFIGLSAVVVKADHYLIGIPVGLVLIGWVLTGIFVIGHDAGHRSFANNEATNNLVGHLTTSFLGWPFHLWRLAHNVHHLHTNNVRKDVAWEPHTHEQIARLAPWYRATYTTVRSTLWAFWAASLFHNFGLWFNFLQGTFYKPEDRAKIAFSIALTVLATSGYACGSYALAGWYGVITLFVLPQLGFYFWLTIFTLLHHTHPELTFMSEERWNRSQAQLRGTVNVRYGRAVDFFTHDIAWHIPHHVSVGIPFYHLKAAHRHLAKAFPDHVRDMPFSMGHLRAVLSTCQAVESHDDPVWTKFARKEGAVTSRHESPAAISPALY